MIAGKKYSGLQVDIWSSGIILFAMVCGYLPFEDPDTGLLYKKIVMGQYESAPFISLEAKDIISRILTVEPQKRATIEELRIHPWFSKSKPINRAEGIIVGKHKIPVFCFIQIDESIIKKVAKLGKDPISLKVYLDSNIINEDTTAYHLLLAKHIRDGGFSIADLNSAKIESISFAKSSLLPQNKNGKIEMKDRFRYQSLNGREKEETRKNKLERIIDKTLEKSIPALKKHYLSFDFHAIKADKSTKSKTGINKTLANKKNDVTIKQPPSNFNFSNIPKKDNFVTERSRRNQIQKPVKESSSLETKPRVRTEEDKENKKTIPLKSFKEAISPKEQKVAVKSSNIISSNGKQKALSHLLAAKSPNNSKGKIDFSYSKIHEKGKAKSNDTKGLTNSLSFDIKKVAKRPISQPKEKIGSSIVGKSKEALSHILKKSIPSSSKNGRKEFSPPAFNSDLQESLKALEKGEKSGLISKMLSIKKREADKAISQIQPKPIPKKINELLSKGTKNVFSKK